MIQLQRHFRTKTTIEPFALAVEPVLRLRPARIDELQVLPIGDLVLANRKAGHGHSMLLEFVVPAEAFVAPFAKRHGARGELLHFQRWRRQRRTLLSGRYKSTVI